ncbi:hypothetical protein EYC80_003916 [Monilinia laxa]|uniref:Uncharacterized protein n=1 Tax=Monilinia laxa TaxID=61186 RepID=A0A5N6KL57_MONLA|nr:hypothetical protein EYC80_003916 [Monilinia laxa]
MVHARTFSRQLGSTLPMHNQPQIPPQTVNSEDPHRPKYSKTLYWNNSLLNSVQSSHIKISNSFGKLLTNIKTLPLKSKLILGLLCILSLISILGAVSGVRPGIFKGGYRDPYTRIHYATHNTGPKFNHNGDKGVKREEPPIPVEAVGLTPKKITPFVHSEGKKVKRGEAPVMGRRPRNSTPRNVVDEADAPATIPQPLVV